MLKLQIVNQCVFILQFVICDCVCVYTVMIYYFWFRFYSQIPVNREYSVNKDIHIGVNRLRIYIQYPVIRYILVIIEAVTREVYVYIPVCKFKILCLYGYSKALELFKKDVFIKDDLEHIVGFYS